MRKHIFFTAIAMALLLPFAVSPVHAAFSFTPKPPAPKHPETKLNLAGSDKIVLTQIGPSKCIKKESRGNSLLLPIALELISPAGWIFSIEKELLDKKVSWQSKNGDWVKTLETLGRKKGVRFVVNWRSRKIAAGEGEIKVLTKRTAKIKAEKKKEAGETAKERARKEDDGSASVRMPEKPWKLKPGSLREQLKNWSDRAGYKLIWDNHCDYQVEAGQAIYGEYTKAVNRVITALSNDGARIKADIHAKNKVLYISGAQEK